MVRKTLDDARRLSSPMRIRLQRAIRRSWKRTGRQHSRGFLIVSARLCLASFECRESGKRKLRRWHRQEAKPSGDGEKPNVRLKLPRSAIRRARFRQAVDTSIVCPWLLPQFSRRASSRQRRVSCGSYSGNRTQPDNGASAFRRNAGKRPSCRA